MKFSSRYGVLKNTKTRIINLTAAVVLAVTGMSSALPLFLSQKAFATTTNLYSQSFSSGVSGWYDDGDYSGYGSITNDGSGHGVVDGVGGGPFTRFDGYKSVWPGTYTTSVDVYLDPSWTAGSGFDYSVAANGSDGAHQRDFVFQVAKDTSEDKLLVGVANGSNFATVEDLEARDNQEVTTADWYTLQHTFSNVGGQLSVTLTLLHNGTELKSWTLSSSLDTIPAEVGGNRYGWFTFVNVAGGLQIDNATLDVDSGATLTSGSTTDYYDTLQSALADAVAGDTVTLLDDVNLSGTYLDVNTDGVIIDGAGHTLTTNNQWVSGSTGNGTTDYVVQLNASDVTIEDLTIEGTAVTSPAGGINVFDQTGVDLVDITSVNNSVAVAAIGSDVTVTGLHSSGSAWGHAIDVDQGSAPNPAVLTVVGSNTWDEARFIYVDNVSHGSVVDAGNQYKKVLLTPNLANEPVTAAIYTSPTASVDKTLSVTTTSGVASTDPLAATLTLESPTGTVEIPAGTVISGDAWDGVLSAPNVSTANVQLSGYTVSDVVAISVGSSSVRLTFSEPVKVTLPGQAGKLAGFFDHSGVFHPITTQCGVSVSATLTGGVQECWTTNGSDLVIWTLHFTTFVAYTATAVPAPATSNGTTTTTSSSSKKAAVVTTTSGSVVDSAANVLGVTSGTSSEATKTPAITHGPSDEDRDTSSNFLGLGWWWLLVLAAVAALGYLAVVRRADR
jgi:hypothetical protein